MKLKIQGYRNGVPWPEVGDELDVPEHEADDLISQGYAEEAISEGTSRRPHSAPAADPAENAASEPDGAGAPEPDAKPVRGPRGAAGTAKKAVGAAKKAVAPRGKGK
ncbi:MAG TPA: hypothetical protein VHC63_13350 [Acidimicrobiales bacterium]|nr:hypothetical protein [Acidimicrobiales bacterium]